MTTGADVVACARTQLGVPWRHQARLWDGALDCAGLVIGVARKLGLVPDAFDIGGYARQADGSLLGVCADHMQRLDGLELGAVLVLAVDRDPQHLGIVADYRHGGWSLVHAASGAHPGRVIETRLMFARGMQYRGAFRLPGVH